LAGIEVAAEHRRTAHLDVTQDAPLLEVERIGARERFTAQPHHIGHLVRGAKRRRVLSTLRVDVHRLPEQARALAAEGVDRQRHTSKARV
jgi:hypothetical protein